MANRFFGLAGTFGAASGAGPSSGPQTKTVLPPASGEGSDVTVFYSGHGLPGLKNKRRYASWIGASYTVLIVDPSQSVQVAIARRFSGK